MSDNFFKTRNGITVGSLSGAPANPVNGDVYYDSTLGEFQAYQNGAWGPLGGGSGGGGGYNLLTSSDNPDFESGTTNWTASGGTFTSITSGQLYGSASGQWTASAASQTLYSNLKSIVTGLKGNSCLAAISYSYASGANGDYSMVVSDGTNVLATQSLNVTTTPQDASLSFICPSSGSLKVGLISNVASPSAIIIDGASFNGGSVLLGSNILVNNLTQASFYGDILWPNAGQQWSTTSATWTNYTANASMGTPTVSENASAPGTKIPAVVFSTLPAGRYRVIVQGNMTMSTGTDACAWRISDGTNSSGLALTHNTVGNFAFNTLEGHFNYSSAQSNVTFQIQAINQTGSGGCNIQLNNTNDTLSISVYKYPTTTQQAYTAAQTPASWSGYHTLSSGWTTASATYADPSAGSGISLTQITSRNLVCSADASLPAISCNFPKAGMYRISAGVNMQGGTGFNLSARLVDSVGTIIDPGHTVEAGTSNQTSLSLQGLYYASSAGSKTIKVQVATSSPSPALTVLNGSAAGSSAIQWVIEDADAESAAPVLVNSVNSSSKGIELINRLIVTGGSDTTACTSSPCTIDSQSGSSVTSVTRSATGTYTINIAPGTYSSRPTWVITGDNNGSNNGCHIVLSGSTATALNVQCVTLVGNPADSMFTVLIMGAH